MVVFNNKTWKSSSFIAAAAKKPLEAIFLFFFFFSFSSVLVAELVVGDFTTIKFW